MNKPTPKINFEHLSQQKPPSNKKEGKKKKKKETEEDNSTRELRFERRKFANFLTFIFYILFFSMFIVILVFNSRLGAINKVASQKAVNTEKIATTIQDQTSDLDTIKYESKTFLTTLFTYDPTEKEKKEREAHLQTYLGNNLEASNLLFQSGNSKRVVNELAFINYERLSNNRYTLFYNVSYTEENQPIKLGVKLTVSYKNNQFQLINLPTITMYQENEKEPTETYDPKVYYAKGEEVSSETEKKINTFLQNFFEMYLSNDERLSLISAIKGIGTGTLDSFTIDNLVQTGEDTYSIQGTYTFHMKEDSQLTSFYDCQIKTNKDSFFVETFN